jgi:hypothetical protein
MITCSHSNKVLVASWRWSARDFFHVGAKLIWRGVEVEIGLFFCRRFFFSRLFIPKRIIGFTKASVSVFHPIFIVAVVRLFGCFFSHYNHHFLGVNPKDSKPSGGSPVEERTGQHRLDGFYHQFGISNHIQKEAMPARITMPALKYEKTALYFAPFLSSQFPY